MCDCSVGNVSSDDRARERCQGRWEPQMNVDARRGMDVRRMSYELPDFEGLNHCQSSEVWAELIALTNPDFVDETTQLVRRDGGISIPSIEEAQERLPETYWGATMGYGGSADRAGQSDQTSHTVSIEPGVIPSDQLAQMMDTPELRLHEVAAERNMRAARSWDPMNADNNFFRPSGLLETSYIPQTAINPTMITLGDQLFEDVRTMIPLDDVPPEVMTQIRDYCDIPQRTAHLSSSQARTFLYQNSSGQDRSLTVTLSPRVTYFQHIGTVRGELQVDRSLENESVFESSSSHGRGRSESRGVTLTVPLGRGAQLRTESEESEDRSSQRSTRHSEQVSLGQENRSDLSTVERFQADVTFAIDIHAVSEGDWGSNQHIEGTSGIVDVRFSMDTDDCRGERGARSR